MYLRRKDVLEGLRRGGGRPNLGISICLFKFFRMWFMVSFQNFTHFYSFLKKQISINLSKRKPNKHWAFVLPILCKISSNKLVTTNKSSRLYFKRTRLVLQQQRFCLWYKHTRQSTNESHHDWWWSFSFSLFYL